MSIEEMCLQLPIEERARISQVLNASIVKEMRMKMPMSRPAALKKMMADILGVDDVPLKCRVSEYTWARNIIAYQLVKEGMTDAEAGALLGKCRSSVTYMRRRVEEALKYPKQYPDVIYIWKQFQKRIEYEINEGTNQELVGL